MKLNNHEHAKLIISKIYQSSIRNLIVFTISFIIIVILGILICPLFVWQPDNLFYYFLKNVEKNLFLYSLSFWMIGVSFILYASFRKTITYFSSLVQAMENLSSENTDLIELPEELSTISSKLNQMKQSNIRNLLLVKENEQKKNDLIVYLAHDLKTPLTSIIGYLKILEESPDLPIEHRAKYTHITLDKAFRLEDLLNELFEIARFNVGNIVLMKRKLNLKLMLEQILDDFYPVCDETKKRISIDCDDSIFLFADPDKLSRVFHNVIKNAIIYSFENTMIKISVSLQENFVSVCIINEGYTIPSDKLEHIFERFFRLDTSRTSNTGGSGLGLAIAKEIIEAHEGSILAESQNNETKFIISIPQNAEKNRDF